MADDDGGSSQERNQGNLDRVIKWFDSRLGLSHEMLRPAPRYAINPFYWLGALAIVAFVIQGVTGAMMMLYYVPNPAQAYATTLYVFQSVSYGRFLETVHLYTAYAMIMLAFMHMMRGYFVSVHKKPREVMWIVGMFMGFVTLGFGFTGYLLPWTVVSKSATDVGLGMIGALPPSVSSFLTFLIVGSGGDATELLRFYDLHVVVLPAILLVLLVVKMYMMEAHGISPPAGGSPDPKKNKLLPIFPDVSLYLFELAAIFGAAMLLISAVWPLNLPPEYTPVIAGQYTAQPDWYFLWIYQILKISVFEQSGPLGQDALAAALSVVSLIFIVLFLLPFIDRTGKERRFGKRPKYITIGAIFVAELLVLTYWGLLTPGRVIPVEQAAVVLGGTALAVAIVSVGTYKLIFRGLRLGAGPVGSGPSTPSMQSSALWGAAVFSGLLASGSLVIGGLINASMQLVMQGPELATVASLALFAAGLALVVLGTTYLLYRLDLGTGAIKRRVKAFERDWGSL
jgi:quinol-cytochrome oxidoreductase complex cytochrome b subunit